MIPLACTLHFAFLKGTRINFNTVSTNTETTISQAIIHMDCGINKPRIFFLEIAFFFVNSCQKTCIYLPTYFDF